MLLLLLLFILFICPYFPQSLFVFVFVALPFLLFTYSFYHFLSFISSFHDLPYLSSDYEVWFKISTYLNYLCYLRVAEYYYYKLNLKMNNQNVVVCCWRPAVILIVGYTNERKVSTIAEAVSRANSLSQMRLQMAQAICALLPSVIREFKWSLSSSNGTWLEK